MNNTARRVSRVRGSTSRAKPAITSTSKKEDRSEVSVPEKSRRKSPGFWSIEENQKRFINDLESNLDISSREGWYKVTQGDFARFGGSSLLRHYFADSISKVATHFYPGHQWHPWKFHSGAPNNYWNSMENRVLFFETISSDIGVRHLADWYSVSRKSVDLQGGGGLLAKYNDSLAEALMDTYKDHEWHPWNFNIVPKNFWSSPDNRRKFLRHVAQKHQAQEFDDWYHVITIDRVDQEGGRSLLEELYNGSAAAAVIDNFPEHPWKPWRFHSVPKNILTKLTPEQMVEYLKYIQEQLRIRDPSDWYRISWSQLKAIPSAMSITLNGEKILQTLKQIYPGHPWESDRLIISKWRLKSSVRQQSGQRTMKEALLELFPNVDVLEDHRLQDTGAVVSLYVPSLSLALIVGPQNEIDEASQTAALLSKQGVAVVTLPPSWDGTAASLKHMIEESTKSRQKTL